MRAPGLSSMLLEARRVRASLESLLLPDAQPWERAAGTTVPLAPTPIERQPSVYVQQAWRDRHRSAVRELRVRALATTAGLALRLEWQAARPHRRITDVDVFPDACAVLFPAGGSSTDLGTMGSEGAPVEGWHWRAGDEAPYQITAHGLGTVERAADHRVTARSAWSGGSWTVVLARPFQAPGIALEHGSELAVGFAVWSGAARQRAGIKSFSAGDLELRVG